MKKYLPWLAVELVAVILAMAAIAVWRDDSFTPLPAPASSPVAAPAPLDTLVVKGHARYGDYDRNHFGQKWSDDVDVEYGHNGCDTRNDILGRDLEVHEYKARTRSCVVLSGMLEDPYSGETISFQRGQDTSPLVQIDHVVPLANAWITGARDWTPAQRQNFANDPRNLLAVSGALNQQKSAGDAATWLPPNKIFRCEYATRIVEVKAAYGLWVTPAERDALARELQRCA